MSESPGAIKILMRQLNLNNVGAPDFILKEDESMSRLGYLEFILNEEQRMRTEKKYQRRLRQGNIPPLVYNSKVSGINVEQLNRILTLGFTESRGNLIIIGQCRTGKTALASTLAENFISHNQAVYYIKIYDLIEILADRSTSPAAERKYEYMLSSGMIIIDEFLYTGITDTDLALLFRFISMVNDLSSIVIITNRYFDEWLDATEDEFLMQTLIERLIGDCEVFRTQPLKNELLPTRTPKRKKK